MRASKYTKELLAPIVAASRSLADVLRALGLPATGGNYRHISARIRNAGLDASHFGPHTFSARSHAITTERLAALVATSTSVAQVLTALGLPTKGRAYHELVDRIRELALDTSHFHGQAWARGKTHQTDDTIARIRARNRFPDAAVFVENSTISKGSLLLPRLLAMNWAYACAWCGISTWRDLPLALHVDHINGIHTDNRLENLRLLCPNCHSQTPTYCRRRS